MKIASIFLFTTLCCLLNASDEELRIIIQSQLQSTASIVMKNRSNPHLSEKTIADLYKLGALATYYDTIPQKKSAPHIFKRIILRLFRSKKT